MSIAVQITLIICITLIILATLNTVGDILEDKKEDQIMNKKNETKPILIVCDGTEIIFESEYSVKEIVTKIEEEKMYETDSFIEVGEGVYVNPYSVSLVEELKQDN
ncbi:hypothetical protein ACSW9N_05655 [Clostridium perfringens]